MHAAVLAVARGVRGAVQEREPSDGEPSILSGLPPWLLVVVALACLLTAACASGMTLGYMSLDTIGLEIISQSTPSTEAAAAARILPVRENANLLLVTLLLTNTVATELLPLALEALSPGGYFSLVVSVVSLIIFGEIIPQAVCSRHALEVGAYMIPFVRALRILLYPVAAPIAYFLDAWLGEELGKVYTRDELKGLIDVHSRNKYGVLTEDETTILKGTLMFSQETVLDVLTPAEDVYMLDVETKLDRPTLLELLRRGHSRIPLYEGHRNNVVCLLLLKQLVLIDPDDDIPIRFLINNKKKVHKMRVSPALLCSKDALLADVLNEFQHGRSHMAIVYDDLSKPKEERSLLGIVTIEDIIEEILNEEIIDETDVYISNTNKIPVLIRDAEGKLVRTITPLGMSATTLLSRKNNTMRYREIDVEELTKPLAKSLKEGRKKRLRGKKSRSASKTPTTPPELIPEMLVSNCTVQDNRPPSDISLLLTPERFQEMPESPGTWPGSPRRPQLTDHADSPEPGNELSEPTEEQGLLTIGPGVLPVRNYGAPAHMSLDLSSFQAIIDSD